MRMSRRVLVAVAAGLLSLAAAAAHATLIMDSYVQGWVRSDGVANGAADGNDTFTGNEAALRLNSWAAFDLSSLSPPGTEPRLAAQACAEADTVRYRHRGQHGGY